MGKIHTNDDHHTIVAKYAGAIKKNNPEVLVLLAGEAPPKSIEIPGDAPDISLLDPSGETVEMTIEVETAATVNDTQAENRWVKAASLGKKFQLVIPKGMANRARRLCKRFNIRASIFEY